MSNQQSTDLIGTLSVLYELSLSIGRSLDFEVCCSDFLVPLMSRKNLTHSAVWRVEEDGAWVAWSLPEATPSCLGPDDLPDNTGAGTRIGPDHPAWEGLRKSWGLEDGCAAWIPLEGVGFLLLRRDDCELDLDQSQLSQLRPLMSQFAIAIQATDAYETSQSERRRLDLTFDAVNEGIVICDPGGRILQVNERLLGWSAAAADADSLDQLVAPAEQARTRAALQRAADPTGGGRARVDELTLVDAEGRERTVALSLVAAEIGGELQLMATLGDVTEWRRRADALRRASQEAEEANMAKSRFLSRVSHELRTPLNAVIGFTELATLGEIDTETEEHLDRVLTAGRHLLTLIDDVLDVSRVEAGELSLEITEIDPAAIAADAFQLATSSADRAGITAELHVDDDLDLVLADPSRTAQVLLNLLSNAVKFNRPGGRVELRVERVGPEMVFAVRDDGMGIDPADLDRLFVPFDRLGRERTEIEGTGIGLALSRSMADAMGGSIGVESVLGEGSTFRLRLPIAERAIDPHAVADTDPTPDAGAPAADTGAATDTEPMVAR